MVVRKGMVQKYWTHPSVISISTSGNPVEDILNRARSVVFSAMKKGWSGPPFDPFKLAEILHLHVVPTEDVLDARTIPSAGGKVRIEFNPNRPITRVRYSVAHEIAHTLFTDCNEYVRQRQAKTSLRDDEWQLEMLCNIGAAEILMPIGSFQDLRKESLDIDTLTRLQEGYNVSTEALLLRVAKLTNSSCFVFFSSRRKRSDSVDRYVIDYTVFSRGLSGRIPTGTLIPKGSQVEYCTAIGFTAKGEETWSRTIGKIHVECVGLPPYPGHRFPRVVGIGIPHTSKLVKLKKIEYVIGDATEPRGEGNKIIAFIINDKGQSWGAGFARAVQKKWPFVLEEFQYWLKHKRAEFALGNVHTSMVEGDLTVFKMISQHGYGDSPTPRIRYGDLEICLRKLADEAIRQNASVHMPRIGSGQAGGSWWVIEELIDDILVKRGVSVTVYDLPKSGKKEGQQLSFAM